MLSFTATLISVLASTLSIDAFLTVSMARFSPRHSGRIYSHSIHYKGLYSTPLTCLSWQLAALPHKNDSNDITDVASSAIDDNNNIMDDEIRARKKDLLSALESTSLGFSANITSSDRRNILALAEALVVVAKDDCRHFRLQLTEDSSWRFLYGDAPDILGLRGGFFSRLVSIRQEISSDYDNNGSRRQILKVIFEYAPTDDIMALVGRLPFFADADIVNDSLKQSVVLHVARAVAETLAMAKGKQDSWNCSQGVRVLRGRASVLENYFLS